MPKVATRFSPLSIMHIRCYPLLCKLFLFLISAESLHVDWIVNSRRTESVVCLYPRALIPLICYPKWIAEMFGGVSFGLFFLVIAHNTNATVFSPLYTHLRLHLNRSRQPLKTEWRISPPKKFVHGAGCTLTRLYRSITGQRVIQPMQ